MLTQAGFTESERTVYGVVLGDVAQRLAGVEQQRSTASPGDVAAMQALQRQRLQLLADAEARLRAELPEAVMAKLDAHVQNHVKLRIKIYQAPMQ
jgi:hypothetical protein